MGSTGRRATPAMREAAKANLAKGRAARIERLKNPNTDEESSKERWAKLLSGTITVKDLSDKELRTGRLKGKGGSTSKRALPSHLVAAFHDEQLRRAGDAFLHALPIALAEVKRLLEDPDVKPADKIKLIDMITNRTMGKTPDRVVMAVENKFDNATRDVYVERDLDQEFADLDLG